MDNITTSEQLNIQKKNCLIYILISVFCNPVIVYISIYGFFNLFLQDIICFGISITFNILYVIFFRKEIKKLKKEGLLGKKCFSFIEAIFFGLFLALLLLGGSCAILFFGL